jgi:ornithine cyclodeaminase/alanine dehydrogenase
MPEQTSPEFLILSDERLEALGIGTAEIVDTIEQAVKAQAQGEVWAAPKSAMLPGDGRYMMTTLSASDTPQLTVVKSVMVSPRNPARGKPGTEGCIIVQHSDTGELLAVMQAGWVTGVRTAGLSAVVARRLANPQSSSIAFIGAGVQARSHLDTFADLFPVQRIRIFGRGQANIEILRKRARDKSIDAEVCDKPEDAVRDADLIVSSVTLAFDLEPFVDAGWLKPGAFAAVTDAGVPWHRHSIGSFGTIIIDNVEQERLAPKKMVELDHVTGDLEGLVTGRFAAGFDPAHPSAFIYRGLAIGDFAVSGLAYTRARQAGTAPAVHW